MKKILYPLLLSTLLLGACSQTSTSSQSSSSSLTTSSSTSSATTTNVATTTDGYFGDYEEEDLDTSYDESSATTITLSDDTTVDGDGVSVDGQTVTINAAGTYVISGKLSSGQLIVNVGKEEKIHLIFKDVTITSEDGPAVWIQQTEKAIITLAEGTTNTFEDSTTYTLDSGETEPDATIYSKEDLVFNGTGTLKVTGNYNNGIRGKDDVSFISGTYVIKAKHNGIKGKDSVAIRDGKYTIETTEGDGIQANNSEDTEKGYVAIDGGTIAITSARDGIQAETNLSAQNAKITIQTAEGYDDSSVSVDESYKGLKAGGNIELVSGTIAINSADDSVHANGNVILSGAIVTAQSGDDGVHADDTTTISDGTVTIQNSYEGLEGSVVAISGGTVSVTASDDGINAAGGGDSSSGGQFGQDSFGGGGESSDDSKEITITGGTITIDAEGDGLDSNGNIKMSGGTVAVYGPTQGGNGALDYNGDFTLTGGTLVAAGTTDMAENVSDDSTVTSVGIYFDSTQSADTLISLKDSTGNTIIAVSPTKEFQHLVIATAKLSTNEIYVLVKGGTLSGDATNGLSVDGIVSGGTQLGTLDLTATVTNVSQDGSAASTNSFGGGGRGRN